MKYGVFDTETSGLPNYRAPADDPSQPRLAHFYMILTDENLEPVDSIDMFVRPDGWAMDPGATAINGLTTDHLMEVGVPVKDVLDRYAGLIDEGYEFFAYGAQFDAKIMRGEMRRIGMDDRFTQTRNTCLMRACQGIVIRPDGKKSWPKLEHACAHFEIENPEAHSGEGDAIAALLIAQRLKAMNALPQPTVHYAKNRP